MNIPNKEEFEPSTETLRKWLACRKPQLGIAGGKVALLSDMGNSTDSTFFMLSIIGEAIGALVILSGGFLKGGEVLTFAILAVVFFIVFDYLFAWKLHRNKGRNCALIAFKDLLNHGKSTLSKVEIAERITRIDNILSEGAFSNFVLIVSLFVISIAKIIGMFLLGIFPYIMFYIPLSAIYLGVVYVHIQHTGYYFAYHSTETSIARERKMLSVDRFVAQDHSITISDEIDFTKDAIHYFPHSIIKMENKKYKLRILGVLTDDDIRGLIASQSLDTQEILFYHLRHIQFTSWNLLQAIPELQ